MSKYRVKAIFGPTLQGEGSHVGTPVKFLRMTGCNRWSGLPEDKPSAMCHFCDTDFRGGDVMTAPQVLQRLDALGDVRTVVISGGEPTLQLDEELLATLKAGGYAIHLETNGSKALGDLAGFFSHVTCSPKQARSETRLERCDDLKLLWPPIDRQITPEAFQGFERKSSFLQPLWEPAGTRVNVDSAILKLMTLGTWRLSLQMHKLLGVE